MCVLCFATTRPMRSVNPWLKWSTFFFSACCLVSRTKRDYQDSWLHVLFNLQVAGILVMATSLILSFKPAYSYVFFNDNQYYGVILAAGAVLTLAGILGCVGALSRSSCLLYTVIINNHHSLWLRNYYTFPFSFHCVQRCSSPEK